MVGENIAAAEPQRAGLTALVVYLRPVPRLRLLRLLAELGIFVVEHEGRTDALRTAFGTRTDFIIVAGDDDPDHAELAGRLLQALSSVLVVVLPPAADPEPYREAGAAVCIPEDVSDGGFTTLLGPAVREARAIRRTGEIAAEYLVFRDIRFRTVPPELLRDGLSVSLTPVESKVLGELSKSLGQVVRNEALEHHVMSLSSRAELRAGYVKAIIRRIRRKVEQVGGNAELLRNIRGFGYMLVS